MAQRILVFSGKGGVGKSSVTVLLGSALSALGKKVLLIDADIGFRSLDLLMNVGTEVVFNWLDIIENRCDAQSAVVKSGNNKPSLLSAPSEYSDSLTQQSMLEMLDSFNDSYDFIFIDSPAGAGEFHTLLSECCDRAIVVTTPDTVAVRNAAAAVDKVLTANNRLNSRLVINRFFKSEVFSGKQIKPDDIIDSTGVQLIGVIPEDDSIRLIAQGERPVKYASDAFLRTAKRLCGENILFNPKDFY